MMWKSTKTWEHAFSAAFRQWRAGHSHCRFIHGYALTITLVFEASELDSTNWVVDFGGLKDLKKEYESLFDHKLVVASDDPDMLFFQKMELKNMCELVVLEDVGCEAFAKEAFVRAKRWLEREGKAERVTIVSAEVREHAGNSAVYEGL